MALVFIPAAAAAGLLTPGVTVHRHGLVRMQEGGPGYKAGGIEAGVAGGKYSSEGMSTKPKPMPTLRPDVIDYEAAAANRPGPDEKPVDASMAGGFGKAKVPFVDTLVVGSGRLAGDVGFDPLQLATNSQQLTFYREAEMKHARLAMLAALGWPVAEKLNGPLSSALGQESLLQNGLSPSILNGGLGSVSVIYWLAALGLAVAAESIYLDKQLGVVKDVDYVPGMLNIDPLGLDGGATRNAEIWSGRVAMVAVVVYAIEESITKAPVLGF
jgi:hypothetical protein